MTVLAMLFSVLGVRLFQLQVVDPDRFVAYGEDIRNRVVDLPAPRGAIYDRNGADLVLPIDRFSIFADPSIVGDDAATVAQRLAPLTGRTNAELIELLERDTRFVYIARDVSSEVAIELQRSPIPGVDIAEEAARYRPAGNSAGALLGTVNIDNKGVSGVELRYNSALRGEPGSRTFERDGEGRTIAPGGTVTVDPVAGTDLYLTIDRDLQLEAERIVGDEVSRREANWGVAVIADPKTGEVLAMVSMDRDPETGLAAPSALNRAISHTVEAGSVMKAFPYAGALHDGRIRDGELINVPDEIEVAGQTWKAHSARESGALTPADMLATSSNPGAIDVALRMEPSRLHHWFEDFGFGSRTGLRLPGEERGRLRTVDKWTEVSPASMAIGYELSVTPAQISEAYNIIANDGLAQPLQLLSATRPDGADGRKPAPAADGRRVISAPAAKDMRKLLAAVVDEGTGTLAQVPGYTSAGKTGTANQLLEDGTYGEEGFQKNTVSFAGMAPAENPELTVVVVMDDPKDPEANTGGKAAAPVFRKLMDFALPRRGVVPDRTEAGLFEERATSEAIEFDDPVQVVPDPIEQQGLEQQALDDQRPGDQGADSAQNPPVANGASTSPEFSQAPGSSPEYSQVPGSSPEFRQGDFAGEGFIPTQPPLDDPVPEPPIRVESVQVTGEP